MEGHNSAEDHQEKAAWREVFIEKLLSIHGALPTVEEVRRLLTEMLGDAKKNPGGAIRPNLRNLCQFMGDYSGQISHLLEAPLEGVLQEAQKRRAATELANYNPRLGDIFLELQKSREKKGLVFTDEELMQALLRYKNSLTGNSLVCCRERLKNVLPREWSKEERNNVLKSWVHSSDSLVMDKLSEEIQKMVPRPLLTDPIAAFLDLVSRENDDHLLISVTVCFFCLDPNLQSSEIEVEVEKEVKVELC
ncbi:hypothetical protein HZA38_06425 [Candidatus Peregrinibacteria bacterium]|nr:hypothetical protein [Candidatus Peregrinibacteria bacterium]